MSEFNHFELRDYDPVIGRWMNVDPMRQHYSPYLAMGNNPILRIDPDGGIDGCRRCERVKNPEQFQSVADGRNGSFSYLNGKWVRDIVVSAADQDRAAFQARLMSDPIFRRDFGNGDAITPVNIEFDVVLTLYTLGSSSFTKSLFTRQGAKTAVTSTSDDIARLFKPTSEFDVTTTLYRGTTGTEAGGSIIFLTDDAAVAATYVKNGGRVMHYEVSRFSLESLKLSGNLSTKTGIHGVAGKVSTEYMFQGSNVVEALNSIAK